MADLTLALRGFGWRRIPGAAYMLAGLAVGFAASSNGFVNSANLANIGMQSTILLLLALPMTLIILTEGIDLSMGAVLTLACVMLAAIAVKTGSVGLALAGALALGAAFGFANGALVAWLGLPPFVTTLGTLGIASGLALVMTNAQSITGLGDDVVFFYSGRLADVPVPLLVAVVAYLCTHWLLYQTRFGTYVFALGGNREALRLAGVRANAYLVGVYVFGGAMAGLAALLLTARMSAAHPTAAIGMEFDAIAAVIAGGTERQRGNGWLPGTALGVLTIGVLKNGLNVLALPSSLQVASIGVLLIVALLIDSFRKRKK